MAFLKHCPGIPINIAYSYTTVQYNLVLLAVYCSTVAMIKFPTKKPQGIYLGI